MKITGNLKRHYLIAFWISLVCSIGLLVGGFLTPPQGEISGSVLEGAGLIFLYPALSFAAKALEEKNKIMIQHGQTTIQIGQDELEEGIEEDAETETL
jgi:hypothetical protein